MQFSTKSYSQSWVDYSSHHFETLRKAVEQSNERSVKELVRRGYDVNVKNELGITPIFYADFGNPMIIKLLIDGGAHLNVCNAYGNTPLHVAISMHTVESSCFRSICRMLEARIDVNIVNCVGDTALDQAVKIGFIDIVEALLSYGANVNRYNCVESVLSVAAKAKNLPLFKLLLRYGAEVNHKDRDGTSPIHHISWLTDHSTILEVIERTADINQRDQRDTKGYSLLHYAVNEQNKILVQLLLEGGAEVSSTTQDYSDTALHFAVRRNSKFKYDIIKVLLEHGANCNQRDTFGSTPLLCALEMCDANVIKLFSTYGADFKAVDSEGDTAMHCAAENLRGEVINFLLDIGFDVDTKNTQDETALHVAVRSENPDVCSILLERGADIFFKDIDGHTPLRVYVEDRDTWEEITEESQLIAFALIEHIAKLKYLNSAIDPDDRELIRRHQDLKKHYKACKRELRKMKNIRIDGDLSLFDVLFASKEKMTVLARNGRLVTVIDKSVPDLCENYQIYFSSMLAKFQNEIFEQRQRKEAQQVVSDIMGLIDPFHLVSQKIVSYLGLMDVNSLLSVY